MRPYKIIDDDSIYSFGSLVKNTKHFFKKDKETGKPKFPNSKIKELREVLTLGKEATDYFTKELKSRELFLPEFDTNKLMDSLFIDERTPYFDMIELTELYPKFELEKEES